MMAGAEGIEPSSKVLETSVLPLNQAPSGYLLYLTLPFRQEANPCFFSSKVNKGRPGVIKKKVKK